MSQEKKHLTSKAFSALSHDNLLPDYKIEILEHLSECPYCMEIYIEHIQQQEAVTMPSHIKEEIIQKSHKTEQQNNLVIIDKLNWQAGSLVINKIRNKILAFSKKPTKNMQFFSYSLRVGFAMICGLYFTFSGFFYSQGSPLQHKMTGIKYETFQNITTNLRQFTEQVQLIPDSKVIPNENNQNNLGGNHND